jgi:hypothetical protein
MQESSSFERDEDEELVRWLKELTKQERLRLCVTNDPKYILALHAKERLRQNRHS